MNILAVIPARGGSKGIPRKNLRLLNGKPLIYYTINSALKSKFDIDIYVTSDDDEILHTAKTFGAKVRKREPSISDDKSTLDPVIYDCYTYAKEIEKKEFELILTLQPTSPLLKSSSIDKAIEMMISGDFDTIISAKDDTHLSWKKDGDKFIPNYEKRLNRQYLTPLFTETGGILATRNNIISQNNRIGKNVNLLILSGGEEIDIDTYEDFNLCEYYMKRKNILFVVTGNETLGLGHVYNTLLIANDIVNHKISFLVDKNSLLAYKLIASKNYPVYIQQSENIVNDIKKIAPSIVINDLLDTKSSYIKALKGINLKVINFEDLGEGAREADLVINAIYPEKRPIKNHYFGQNYFILRDEFIYSKQKIVKKEVTKVLITFGGVDPNNYTKKVLSCIYPYCLEKNIKIMIVAGIGYDKYDSISHFKEASINTNVTDIAKFMLEADIVFTSAGRTTYEIASIGTPAIVLAQNQRELTHFFSSSEFGFLNLGLGTNTLDSEILTSFDELVNSYETRAYMSEKMKSVNLKNGRKIVVDLIKRTIDEYN